MAPTGFAAVTVATLDPAEAAYDAVAPAYDVLTADYDSRRCTSLRVREGVPDDRLPVALECSANSFAERTLTVGAFDVRDRQLLLARYWQELPHAETARRHGLTETTVRVRLHRLHNQLRTLLREPA